MSKRSSLFGDLSDITPSAPKASPDQEAVKQAAEESGFVSRDPAAINQTAKETERPKLESIPTPERKRPRRTGRTHQLNLKLRPEDVQRFYDICDERRWPLGEGFERALEALEKELKG